MAPGLRRGIGIRCKEGISTWPQEGYRYQTSGGERVSDITRGIGSWPQDVYRHLIEGDILAPGLEGIGTRSQEGYRYQM